MLDILHLILNTFIDIQYLQNVNLNLIIKHNGKNILKRDV